MIVYCLRHKVTGKWMPARMFRASSHGWSFWNPYETRPGYVPHDANPRVFFTKQSALNAKSMWEAGEWRKGWTAGSYFEPPEETTPAPYDPEDHKRARGDLEVVAMTLEEKANE